MVEMGKALVAREGVMWREEEECVLWCREKEEARLCVLGCARLVTHPIGGWLVSVCVFFFYLRAGGKR